MTGRKDYPLGRLTHLLSAIILVFAYGAAKAENYQELLLFPNLHLEYIDNPPQTSDEGHNDVHMEAALDLFFALSYENTRFLTEALASTEEVELERAQLGWEYRPGHRLWLGRFHTPLGYWNPKFNHSAFLQTSVHRPDIVNFEDHGGVLPMHAAGIMSDGEQAIGEGNLEYTFIYGAGAKLAENELTSTRLIDIREEGLGINLFGKIAYQPDELSQTHFGLFGGYSELTPTGELDTSVDQVVGGAYFHTSWLKSRVYGGVFYSHNTVKTDTTKKDYFVAGYLHGEYELPLSFVTYLRHEESYNAQNNVYINLLTPLAIRKETVGLRYDITKSHAISAEVSLSQLEEHRQIHSSLQWSAVFP
jgi:hypothetical protein